MMDRDFKIISGGTDNHLFLVDLRGNQLTQEITGKDAEIALGQAFITLNKNSVPNDSRSPFITSGLRIGTPAVTTRGLKEPEVTELAHWICDLIEKFNTEPEIIEKVRRQVLDLCRRFPVYGS